MPLRRWFSFLVIALALFAVRAQAQQPAYLDPKLPPAERAHDLVGRMTVQKVTIFCSTLTSAGPIYEVLGTAPGILPTQ